MSFKLSQHAAALLCAGAGALFYLNTLPAGFCFDDLSAIKQNHDLRPSTPWLNLFKNDFWGTPMHIEGSHKSYRPLCVASFRLNYMLHGLDPMGYHLVNVLLHAVVCYLYVQFCALVFTAVWPALLAGLFFAVHPIHTEAVAGVVGRAELLASVLFLLTLKTYIHATVAMATNKTSSRKEGAWWLVCTLVLCFFSVLCKEQGITAIAVALSYDLFVFHQHTLQSALMAFLKGNCWPRYFMIRGIILIGFTVGVMFLRLQIMQTTLPIFTTHDNPAVALPTPYRQLHWLHLVAVNLWLLLCPSFLCADWTMATIPLITSLHDIRHLLTLTVLLSLVLLSTFSLTSSSKRAKACILALALMVFPFLPASNLFFPVGFVVAERVLYLPSMGFCMLVALGLSKILSNGGKMAIWIVFALGLCFTVHSLKTVVRNQDWKNDNSLFRSAIRINHGNGKMYNNLGHDYEEAGNHTYARKLFTMATKVQPDDIGAFINLGRTLKLLGNYQEAEQAYLHAIELMPSGKSFRVAPSHINVYYNLANLVKMDPARLEEAFRLYQQAIAMKPDFVEAHMNKGDVLLHLNHTEEARQAFEMALSHNPDYADAHYNLGTALLQLGKQGKAENSYRKALGLDPTHIHALLALAGLLQEEDKKQEALQLYQQVLTLDSSNVRAYFSLALLHLDDQNLEKSENLFLHTLSLEPTHRSALYNLGVLYSHQELLVQAVEHLKQLVSLYPNHMNGARLLGDCYMKTNRPALAEQMYRHVLQSRPDHIPALHNLGVVKAENGNFESARILFEKVLSIDPSHSASRKHLEQVQVQLHKWKNANSTTRT